MTRVHPGRAGRPLQPAPRLSPEQATGSPCPVANAPADSFLVCPHDQCFLFLPIASGSQCPVAFALMAMILLCALEIMSILADVFAVAMWTPIYDCAYNHAEVPPRGWDL